ncbi:MAG TPA: type 4b pilus protein PilO2 [Ramlibacter sp.]|jgi:hypothetical protein|nr:type 4b pilus protein PilO2 [Ramlibacter sp.]
MELVAVEANGRRHELAAGLVWHPLQGTGADAAREVLAFARDAGADLKLLRGEEAPHVGLARRSDGARAGQVSAAAVIADALAQEGYRSVLAALRLPENGNRFLYLATRDQVILADGDTVGAETEIRDRVTEDCGYGGWDCVLCPVDWGLPAAQERSFESFFSPEVLKNSRPWQLRELRINVARAVLIASTLVGLAVAGTWGWRSHQERRQLAQAQALQEQQQVQRAHDARNRRPAAPPAPPWPLMPRPAAFAQACTEALARTGTVAGNWKLDGATCEAGQLTVRWTKGSDAAWVSHLRAVRPQAVVAEDGLSALVSTPAAAPVTTDHPEALSDLQPLRLRYADLASRYGMAVRIEPVPLPRAAAPLPGQAAAPPPPPLPWSETTVQATVSFDPVQAARLLDAPGLRLRRLVFAFGKDGIPRYEFTGVHYVRP